MKCRFCGEEAEQPDRDVCSCCEDTMTEDEELCEDNFEPSEEQFPETLDDDGDF